MDEPTFQRELMRLKHHVSQLEFAYQPTTSHHPAPLASRLSHDAFGDQMQDIKAQLLTMQTSLDSLAAVKNQQYSTHAQPYATQLTQLVENSLGLPHLALPSDPLFWQLFSSLRTDVKGLDNRVAAVEANVSDLEHRVDQFEPVQYTPPGSEDAFSMQPCDRAPAQVSVPQAPDALDCPPATNPDVTTWHAGTMTQDNNAQPTATGPVITSMMPAAEGVAFRDKEITQLEERMRETQASLSYNEDLVSQKDAHIKQLSCKQESLHARISELGRACAERDQLLTYHRNWSINEDQCKDLVMQRWASMFHASEEAHAQTKAEVCNANQQIANLQLSLQQLQASKQHEIHDVTVEKDKDIKKLRDICAARETFIRKRGGSIIKDKNAELERLSQELKASQDDCYHEAHERARCEAELSARETQISILSASLKQATIPKSALCQVTDDGKFRTDSRQEHRATTTYPPFATAGVAGQPFNTSNWTPQAFGYARTPQEQRRTSFWEAGLNTTSAPSFGVPEAFTSPPTAADTAGARETRREARHSDSVRLLEGLTLAEDGSSRSRPEPSNTAQRKGLPLDPLRPPLPAPLSPRKRASDEGLRPRSQGGDEASHTKHPISRHRSVQELPHNSLQPYVEEEGDRDGVQEEKKIGRRRSKRFFR